MSIDRKQQIIGLINEARQACGLKALRAIRRGASRQAENCPLARSLPAGVAVQNGFISTRDRKKADAIATVWGVEPPRRWKRHPGEFQVNLPEVLEIFIIGADAVGDPR
jgi:hypothetical protein